jgi:hypothetical protein
MQICTTLLLEGSLDEAISPSATLNPAFLAESNKPVDRPCSHIRSMNLSIHAV